MTGRPMRALVLLALLGGVIAPAPLSANDLDDELRRVSNRIQELAAIIDDVTASRSSLAGEIKEAAAQLVTLESELAAASEALAEIQSRVTDQRSALHTVSEDLKDAYADLSVTHAAVALERVAAIESARSAYVAGPRDLGVLAIATDEINSVAIGMEYLSRVGSAHEHVLATFAILQSRETSQRDAILQAEAALRVDLGELEVLEAGLEVVRKDYVARQVEMQSAIEVQAYLLDTLDEEIAHFESDLEGLQADQGSLRRRIAREQAASKAEAVAVSSGGFVRPVPGAITSGFGPRYHPILGYSRPHNGVDFRASYGQSIKAAQSGVVILANVWGGYGRTIIIDHGNGLSTLYAHQSSLSVSYGDRVQAGAVIGRVGTSGLSTGAHLHFEVRIGGDPVDPAPYLSG